mgnify:CR=1 FL=1
MAQVPHHGPMRFFKPSSLTAKTLAWVVVASLVAFAAITGVTVWQERALLLQRAHEQAQRSVQQNLPALGESLWNFNNASLRALLSGMVGEGAIVRADILDGERTLMTVSRPGEVPPIDTTWTIPIADPTHPAAGQPPLGEIRVYESYTALRAQQAETAWRIAIAQLLQIASIAAMLVVIVRWLIMRHLSALARAVTGLNPLDHQDRIRLQRQASGALAARRHAQDRAWMWERIEAGLKQRFRTHPAVQAALDDTTRRVLDGTLPASTAARRLLAGIHQQGWIVLGLLDDVILLELAWPAVATEAEDYRDFCAYRNAVQPQGDGAQRREAWVRERLDALALYQHHARVNARRYVQGGSPERPFRVA